MTVRFWRRALLYRVCCYPDICLEWQKETIKTFGLDGWSTGKKSNLVSAEHDQLYLWWHSTFGTIDEYLLLIIKLGK